MYPNPKRIDANIPFKENTKLRKSSLNFSIIKKIQITNKNIKSIDRDDLIIIKEYIGIILSFQLSLTFLFAITIVDFFINLINELIKEKYLNLSINSIEIIMKKNKMKKFTSYFFLFLDPFFFYFLKPV